MTETLALEYAPKGIRVTCAYYLPQSGAVIEDSQPEIINLYYKNQTR